MNNDSLDKALDKGYKNAVSGVLLWLCAVVGAIFIKAIGSFIKWVLK